MASGKTHELVALFVEAGMVLSFNVATAQLGQDCAVALIAGGLVGILITPDADHPMYTREELRWRRIPVIGPYMFELSAGYGTRYSHRGISHIPFIGTATRFIFFGRRICADVILAVYLLLLISGGGLEAVSFSFDVDAFVMFFVGWAFQDIWHWIFDGCPISWKR